MNPQPGQGFPSCDAAFQRMRRLLTTDYFQSDQYWAFCLCV